jgi:hypothetical protein
MTKTHDLKTVVIDHIAINYFYKREKNDINGNPRFKVFIIDPDGCAIYERIFKTYEGLIAESVRGFVEGLQK